MFHTAKKTAMVSKNADNDLIENIKTRSASPIKNIEPSSVGVTFRDYEINAAFFYDVFWAAIFNDWPLIPSCFLSFPDIYATIGNRRCTWQGEYEMSKKHMLYTDCLKGRQLHGRCRKALCFTVFLKFPWRLPDAFTRTPPDRSPHSHQFLFPPCGPGTLGNRALLSRNRAFWQEHLHFKKGTDTPWHLTEL